MLSNPITEELLKAIFRVDPADPDHLIARESTTVEFKRNFNRGPAWNLYGKTVAAFANTRGGCIVFGVTNSPRRLEGMSNNHFNNLDPEELTNFLNEKFSPEIHWFQYIHEINGNRFGIIYVSESDSKPIVARTNGGDKIYEAEIYYRYRGRSEKIKYPELRRILEEQRKNEQSMWLRHLQSIATIGVKNAAIFNPLDGRVTGRGGTFIIDRKLLPKLQFIREGEFKEVTGAPTIRLVGDAQILATGKVNATEVVIERQSIHAKEIVETFLLQQHPSEPSIFIEQSCYEATGYLPIYYFAQKAEITADQLLELFQNEQSSARGKQGLLERISSGDNNLSYIIPETGTPSSRAKAEYRELFIQKAITEPISNVELSYRLEAIRTLNQQEIDIDYIFPILLNWYNEYWEEGGVLRTQLYKTICHLDKELYMAKIS